MRTPPDTGTHRASPTFSTGRAAIPRRASITTDRGAIDPVSDKRSVIIIGGGPAGYTAALYTARANLRPLVIEGFNWGGQLMITSDVENYPGYADGVMGPTMIQDFRRQAERFGAEYLTDDVTRVDFSQRPFRVWVGDDEYTADSVIVATGATARQLGLESEHGCRVAASRTARPVTPRSSATRSSPSSAAATPRWRRPCSSRALPARCTSSTGARSSAPRRSWSIGHGRTTRSSSCSTRSPRRYSVTTRSAAVRLRDTVTGETSELATDGFFVAIGHDPNTALFLDQLDHGPRADTSSPWASHGDEHPRRLCRRRRPGSRLSPGSHRSRLGLCRCARCRAVPQRAEPRYLEDRGHRLLRHWPGYRVPSGGDRGNCDDKPSGRPR